MRRLRELLSGAGGVLRRDFLLFISYKGRFLMHILSMIFTLTGFYYISRLVSVGSFRTPDDYYAFVVAGLVILQVITSTLHTPPAMLQSELYTGTFERLAVSPFGPVAAICSMLLFPFVYAMLSATIMLVVAWLVFGLPVQWSTAGLGVPVAALGALAFSCFGILITGMVLLFKQATFATTWIIGLVSLAAGLYFPVALLPDWVQWTSDVQPFTPAVDLLRSVLMGSDLNDSAWLDLVKLVGFAAVLVPGSLFLLNRIARVSHAKGTILEY
jgi:ABC-2 type transport system permease protein